MSSGFFLLIFFSIAFLYRIYLATYLFPVTPFLILASVFPIHLLFQKIQKSFLSQSLSMLIFVIFLSLLFFFQFPQSLDRIQNFQNHCYSHRDQNNPNIQLGYYLTQNYPYHTSIVYQPYAFVPSVFVHAKSSYSYPKFLKIAQNEKPKLLIVRKDSIQKFQQNPIL